MNPQNAQTAFAEKSASDPRLTKEAAIAHPAFVARVMALWDDGLDTQEIADRLSEHEHVVACCVRIGRERRRTSRTTAAQE
jgi:hypothetical protein